MACRLPDRDRLCILLLVLVLRVGVGRGGVDLGATMVVGLLDCPAALFDMANGDAIPRKHDAVEGYLRGSNALNDEDTM